MQSLHPRDPGFLAALSAQVPESLASFLYGLSAASCVMWDQGGLMVQRVMPGPDPAWVPGPASPHAELLGRMSRLCAAAGAPLLAAIGTDVIKKLKPDEIHPLIAESWGALRSLPEAGYIGLTVPRFMLRNPYGEKTDPIDRFDFEEFSPQEGLRGMLYASGATLAGRLAGR